MCLRCQSLGFFDSDFFYQWWWLNIKFINHINILKETVKVVIEKEIYTTTKILGQTKWNNGTKYLLVEFS